MWISREKYKELLDQNSLVYDQLSSIRKRIAKIEKEIFEISYNSYGRSEMDSLRLKEKVKGILDHLGLKEKHIPAKEKQIILVPDRNKT